MNSIWLSAYVLVWRVIVAGVLLFIASAFVKEWKQARREGKSLV